MAGFIHLSVKQQEEGRLWRRAGFFFKQISQWSKKKSSGDQRLCFHCDKGLRKGGAVGGGDPGTCVITNVYGDNNNNNNNSINTTNDNK